MEKRDESVGHVTPEAASGEGKHTRRKVVKGLVCGVSAFAAYNTLPAKWGTPILEQVFLPAHAQTSLLNGIFAGAINFNIVSTEQHILDPLEAVAKTLGNFFVSEAVAQTDGPGEFSGWLCVEISDGTARFVITDEGCIELTSAVTETATYSLGGLATYTCLITAYTADTVTVYATASGSDTNLEATVTLSLSNEPCECTNPVSEPG